MRAIAGVEDGEFSEERESARRAFKLSEEVT